ncbi:MAG: FeoB-associated Cys-rich membrane protein [Oscillospiraceae bacterium]|nr:FeoB-associated Cys-rich membrane protein [Oscillospiraceae bacterium]
MSFLAENIGTIVIGLVVAAIVAAIIIKTVRDKRAGRSSCSCGCSGCSSAADCGAGKSGT